MFQLTGTFLLCAILAATISPLAAEYVIDVKLNKFENSDRLLANGRQCSNSENQQCQTTITICAKPDDGSTLCQYGKRNTGVIGDNFIDFNTTHVGALQNPINFLVKKQFKKFVVSFIVKNNNDELIDEYEYKSESNPQLSIEEAKYDLETTHGQFNNFSQLTYQIRSYCNVGYYGSNCTTKCKIPITDQTRSMCDRDGKKVCKAGYSGPSCYDLVSGCHSSPCKNGATCTEQGSYIKCTCKPAYTGQFCNKGIDECRLTPTPCYNGGTCVDEIGKYHCKCPNGFTGFRCGKAVINSCQTSPCQNGGTCYPNGFTFNCYCKIGFTGSRCEQPLCQSNTCQNDGTCHMVNNIITCICQSGFYGVRCELTNQCYPRCQNRGTCNPNTRKCDCPAGFYGNSCQLRSSCYPPCQNGGTCDQNTRKCDCPAGFYGNSCQFRSSCYPPCQNGGTCNQNTRKCYCPAGFYGNSCQLRSSCYSPCQNGGTCKQNTGKCDCLPGFGGPDCSFPDPCASKPCLNNGQCYPQSNYDYTCACRNGWTGKNCETSVSSCAVNPCMNGGQCYPMGTSFSCACQQGWTGKKCEFQINHPCFPNPCLNNGKCTAFGANNFRCLCTNGWYGTLCGQRMPNCPILPCRNGGTCINNANQMTCQCPPGFIGTYCEVVNPIGQFTCPEDSGLFPDPKSCTHFYQCDWSISYRKDCPGNLHFNRILKVCDWQIHANCITRK